MNEKDTWTLVLIAGGVFAVSYMYRCQSVNQAKQQGCYLPKSVYYPASTSTSYPAPGYS